MPNPSASSPDLPALHGHTHRPKALGGTDPIAISAGLPVAFAKDGLRSQSADGELPIDCQFVTWNDDSVFGYAEVSGTTTKRARFLTLKQSGIYMYKGTVLWDSDFTPSFLGQSPYIQPSCYFPSTAASDVLANAIGTDAWDDTQGIIYGEQGTTDESDHHQLSATVVFGLDLAYWEETAFGVGVSLMVLQGPVTKLFGGGITVTRLGDLGTLQTLT